MPERHRVLVAEPLGASGADRLRADPGVDAVFVEGPEPGRAAGVGSGRGPR